MSKSLCYSGKLLPVSTGHMLTISGKTSEAAKYFDFGLMSDNSTDKDLGDIALHCTVNFEGSNEIVRNSHEANVGWGSEERSENLLANNAKNPLEKGGDFKISVYLDSEKFFVSFNEKPFFTYDHRQPFENIKRLNVYGDVLQVCQVNHTIAHPQKHMEPIGSTFNGAIPSIAAETAIVFSGSCEGTAEGTIGDHLSFSLIESQNARVLLQIICNFRTGEIVAIAQEGMDTLSVKVTAKVDPFPIKIDKNFKVSVGVTHKSFTFTVNGENILHCPFEEGNFFGQPLNYLVSSCGGLAVKITGVDAFSMEHGKTTADDLAEFTKPIGEAISLLGKQSLQTTNSASHILAEI